MKTKLLIFPFNGNGLEALGCLDENYEFVGFIDDEINKQGKKKEGFTVFPREALQKHPYAKLLAVPGSPMTYLNRKRAIDSLKIPQTRFATVIHKNAYISPLAKIGFNVLIMAGVVLTSNAIIGNHVCILPNSVIHHDVVVADYVLVGSQVVIAGYVKIHDNCYIGSQSSLINQIEIGKNSLVGIGSNVIKSFLPNSKIVGNPARLINN